MLYENIILIEFEAVSALQGTGDLQNMFSYSHLLFE